METRAKSTDPRQMPRGLYTRRQLLNQLGAGFGAIGLASVFGPQIAGAAAPSLAGFPGGIDPTPSLLPKAPHFAPKAKRVIHLFMNGGPSAMDTFDPKPSLEKYAGRQVPGLPGESSGGAILPSPFKFQKYGKSGIDVSELFPNVAKCADDLCLVRSMYGDQINHEPGIMLMNCGDAQLSRPTLGAWATYGLGTENQNLPGYIALCPGGLPIGENENWRSSFLPGIYQGTHIDTQHQDVDKLIENLKSNYTSLPEQRQQLDLLAQMNEMHRRDSRQDAQLEARIQSFELAYRMQMEATDAFDISKEPSNIREMYGDTVHGRQMLIARRFLERGVRFIQLWHGAGMPWDSHKEITRLHGKLAKESDQPVAALLTDLKARGMLDDTLVIWGGEFGRTSSTADNNADFHDNPGRSHNHFGFSVWMAGGGVKGGYVHGATDEFGSQAVEKKVHVHDLHATILHLLGFDHEQLTYRYSGRDFRLTDVYGNVVHDLIA